MTLMMALGRILNLPMKALQSRNALALDRARDQIR
jgi:hypothetical protein